MIQMNDTADKPDTDESNVQNDDAAGTAAADDASTTDTAETIAALKAKADENWERYVRAAAETENVRKRAVRDVENARRYALENFGRDLLDVRDSLEMGLAAADTADAEALREGSEATLKLLSTVMERFGVEQIDPEGEPFDPELHEAMTMQPSAEVEPNSVLAVIQKGYTLNGRLLRPARVIVAAPLPDQAGT
ncbi:MAG: nucleotide exchange factor GrpE [Woeseiaceae bacterium]|jgi:molecular chaperone GrpE|nr:nucleotide exchange factor GrpE [Woeseiaceae bacterium]